MVVKELVVHILLHVNAEVSSRDKSQTAGFDNRAQTVRDTVAGFANDAQDLPISSILKGFSDAPSLDAQKPSLKRALANMQDARETRPQLAIQAWVGKFRETRGG